MSSESSSFSAGGGVAAAVSRTSGNSTPSPAGAPCPPQLSLEAIASFPPQLPPLDDSRMAPTVASSAAALRARFTTASSDAQALMLSMREVWEKWNLLPILPSGTRAALQLLLVASPGPSCRAAALPRRDADPPCPSPTAAVAASDPQALSSSTSSASTHPSPPLLNHQTEVTRSQVDAMRAELRNLEARLAATGTNSASNPPPPLSPPTAVAAPVNYAPCMALSTARRDLAHMEAVFNRHAKPVGLSAKALVSALHAIDASSFSAEVSHADAKKLMKRVDINNKGHATFKELCQIAKISCDEGAEASPARDEFLRFADVKVLSAPALMDALKEVDAPVLLSGEGCSPEQIFRRADADISGSVDLAE